LHIYGDRHEALNNLPICSFAYWRESSFSAIANDCKETACVNVYTENNQIIIEARKGDKTVKKTIAQSPKKPVVKAKPTKKPLPFFLLPEPKKPVVKKPIKKKPVVKKTI
jgi:hypothetical protein